MRRWGLPAVLALVAAVSGVLAVRAPALPAVRDDSAAVAAGAPPLLSPRRVPQLLSQTIADLRLQSGLDAALADPGLGGGRDRNCLVVRHGERILYERNPDMQLVPASNLKLVTGLAALDKLGPEARLHTEVRGAAPGMLPTQ